MASSIRAYPFIAVAAVLAMIASLFAGLLPARIAEAGNQNWTAINNPATNIGAAGTLGLIGPLEVANDGAIFVATGLVGGPIDRVRLSTNGGNTFNAGTQPTAATAVIDIVTSPTFGTDRTVFALLANGTFQISTNAGTTWAAAVAKPVINAADTGVSIAVAPDFSGNDGTADGIVAVGLTMGGAGAGARALVYTVTYANAIAGAATALGNVTVTDALGDVGDAALDIAFSPNFQSDGLVFVMYKEVTGGTNDFCVTVGGGDICEVRYSGTGAGVTPAAPVLIHAGVAVSPALGVAGQLAIPTGYNFASSDNFFATTSDTAAGLAAAGVYRRTQGSWAASPIPTAPGGTNGYGSIATSGAFASAHVFAGTVTNGTGSLVRKSTNGAQSWPAAATVSTLGGNGGNVVLAVDPNYASNNTVYATSTGNNGGFWRSTNGGGTSSSWGSRGLYTDGYDTIVALALSPNFASDQTAFIVVNNSGGAPASAALFKTTNFRATAPGASWVKTATTPAGIASVGVSKNFASDRTVFIADATGQMARSTDGGDSFSQAFINPAPAGIAANQRLEVANSTTVYAISATGGRVFYTMDSGNNWSTAITTLFALNDLDLSPNFATDGNIVVGGLNSSGNAVILHSSDSGATWVTLGSTPDVSAGSVAVTFDSNFATNMAIYAGTNTTGDVYRWVVGQAGTTWRDLDGSAIVAGGAPAVGTTTLSVSGLASVNGILYVTDSAAAGGVADGIRRAMTPTGTYDGTRGTWWNLGWQPVGGATGVANSSAVTAGGSGKLDAGLLAGFLPVGIAAGSTVASPSLFAAAPGSAHLVTIDQVPPTDAIHVYTDNLIDAVTLSSPANQSTVTAHPTNALWIAYPGAVSAGPGDDGLRYEIQVSRSVDFTDPLTTVLFNGTGGADLATVTQSIAAIPGVPAFVGGGQYYWRVRAVYDSTAGVGVTADATSNWSEVRSYGAAGALPALLTPVSAPGLTTVTTTKQITFNWTAVALATDYRLQVSDDGIINPNSTVGEYLNPVITRTVGAASPSYTLTQAEAALLQDNTQYFWQAQAIFGSSQGNYTNLSAQAGASGFFRTPVGSTTSNAASVALASLINEADPESSILSIAWAQDTATGEFMFLAPGVGTSTLATLQPNTAVFLNLTVTSNLRISGRDPITVPAGGRWIALGSSTLVELVP